MALAVLQFFAAGNSGSKSYGRALNETERGGYVGTSL